MKGRFDFASVQFLLLSTVALVGLAGPIQAQIVTLTNGNSAVQVDSGSQAGMFNWSVDGGNGGNRVAQQQFWYRLGPSGPESSINNLSTPSITTPDAHTLFLSYNNGTLGVETDYILTGGAVGQSGLSESITLKNSGVARWISTFFST